MTRPSKWTAEDQAVARSIISQVCASESKMAEKAPRSNEVESVECSSTGSQGKQGTREPIYRKIRVK